MFLFNYKHVKLNIGRENSSYVLLIYGVLNVLRNCRPGYILTTYFLQKYYTLDILPNLLTLSLYEGYRNKLRHTQQSAAGQQAGISDALDDGGGHVHLQAPARHVVQEGEGLRARAQDVVHTHSDKVLA